MARAWRCRNQNLLRSTTTMGRAPVPKSNSAERGCAHSDDMANECPRSSINVHKFSEGLAAAIEKVPNLAAGDPFQDASKLSK